MLVQPQQTKDDDNELRATTPMNNPTTTTETGLRDLTPITFNVLVVGQAGVGKTGLIKLLLDTSHLSPATSLPQLARLAEFANFAATCPTNSPCAIIAELPETSNTPEIVLKLIDTPGLLYHDAHELEAGIQLVLRQIAESFEASDHASASAQERRDKQIHLCLYLLDPADIVPASTRHLRRPERYGVSPQLTRQRVQLSAMRTAMARTEEGRSGTAVSRDLEDMPHYDDSPEDEWGRATVPTSELNIIRRLSDYVRVLPIVAKADTLTIERLDTVKGAIRRDLIEAGITFTPFESQNTGSSGALPSTPPPDAPAPLLPYAIMIPDRYHHGDGVLRSGTTARPTHQQYMTRYQEVPTVDKEASFSTPSPFVQRRDLVRTYRWGVVDILDPSCSDFLALKEAILGPCVQTLRAYTDEVFSENYRRNLVADARYARESQTARQQPYAFATPEPSGRSLRPNPPSLPPHSLEAYKTDTRSPYSRALDPSSSQYSLAPLEHPPPSGHFSSRSNPPTLTPISTMLNPSLKYGRSNPALTSPDDDAPRSPGPSPIQAPKHRTGRKVAVACNFCRSRKLKCDGGRPQCLQCIRRTVDCEYEPTAKRRGLAKPSDTPPIGSGDPHAHGASPMQGGGDAEGPSIPPKSVACQFCRARKTRCDGLQPQCSNCKKRNQECVYTYGTGYPEEEGGSATPRRFPPSTVGTTSLPPIQSLPLGTALSEAVSPSTAYWHTSSPQMHTTLPPRRSQLSPSTRTRSFPPPGQGVPPASSSSSISRHQVESDVRGFSAFPPPPPSYPTPYSLETRRPSTSGADSQTWRDRSSFSSTSTRGGMSATPSTPNLKRKASHPEDEGDGEVIRLGETSPSPPKRRRISETEERPFSSSTERHRSHPSREEHAGEDIRKPEA